jgi:hypothetical protein
MLVRLSAAAAVVAGEACRHPERRTLPIRRLAPSGCDRASTDLPIAGEIDDYAGELGAGGIDFVSRKISANCLPGLVKALPEHAERVETECSLLQKWINAGHYEFRSGSGSDGLTLRLRDVCRMSRLAVCVHSRCAE